MGTRVRGQFHFKLELLLPWDFSKPLLKPKQNTRREREFIIDNLLVRIHLIIEMILVDRPCAMGVPFSR